MRTKSWIAYVSLSTSVTAALVMAVFVMAVFVMAVFVMATASSYGQQPASAVQLPTFRFFSTSTTVSVPDRGGIYLGGVRRAREGSVTRGLPLVSKLPGLSRLGKNQGIGREMGNSGMSLHATIIDMHEMDEALLGEAQRLAALNAIEDPGRAEASRLTRHIAAQPKPAVAEAAAPTRATPPSVAVLKERAKAGRDKKLEEARYWFTRAERAAEEGKDGVAKIYYQMAGRRGDKELQQLVLKRIRELQGSQQQ